MAVPESGQSPDPPPVGAQAPQEPDAFYAQEYFTSQGEIRFTEEGQAYFRAPSIRGWANVAELQDALAVAPDLGNDLAALAELTSWALSASDDAARRQVHLCLRRLADTIRVDRYDQELAFLAQLEAAVDTVDLALAEAVTRLRDAAGPRTRSGGAPGSPLIEAREYQEQLEDVRATLAKATLGYERTRDRVRREQDDYRRRRTPAGGRRSESPRDESPSRQPGTRRNADDSSRNDKDKYEWYAMKYLQSGPAIPAYSYTKEGTPFFTIVDHLDLVIQKFRDADEVPVVREEGRLTAKQKRTFMLRSFDKATRERVETTLKAQRDVPLKWDPTRTVADLDDIWSFDLESLKRPTVPRTPSEARSFEELLIAIMPKGLQPLDKRNALDDYTAQLRDHAYDNSPLFVADHLRGLAGAIPEGTPHSVSIDGLQRILRQYVLQKCPEIAATVTQLYEEKRRQGDVVTSEERFVLYTEIAEAHWAAQKVHLADAAEANAQKRMATLTTPRRTFGTAAAAQDQPASRSPRRPRLPSRHRAPPQVTALEDDDTSTDSDQPSDDGLDVVYAMEDANERGGHLDNMIELAVADQLTAEELYNIEPTTKNLCFRCGRPGHYARDCPRPATDEARQKENFLKAQLFRQRARGGYKPLPRARNSEIISGRNGTPTRPVFVISSELVPYQITVE